jgi:hypothetical protein
MSAGMTCMPEYMHALDIINSTLYKGEFIKTCQNIYHHLADNHQANSGEYVLPESQHLITKDCKYYYFVGVDTYYDGVDYYNGTSVRK